MSEAHIFSFPTHDGMPPPPPGLQRIRAARQNTLVIQAGEHYRVDNPPTAGGPDVWLWQVINLGPGTLWARWDGFGYAKEQDLHSMQIAVGSVFADVRVAVMTFASGAETTVSFTADNMDITRRILIPFGASRSEPD